MSEENTSVNDTVQDNVPKPVSNDTPRVVKEAEHKLKEMSRKAKERKTVQNNSKQRNKLSEINYFWIVIGGIGALGIGYLVLGNRKQSAPRPKFRSVPRPIPKTPVKEKVEKEERPAPPKFELNCF